MSFSRCQTTVRAHRPDHLSRRRSVGILTVIALVLAGFSVLLAPVSRAAAVEPGAVAPWVLSDQDDYPPGGLVVLTGGDWQPGEAVHLNVNDDQGRSWSRDVDVVADQSGAIRDSFNLPDWFVATYKVVATGQLSGTATTGFTDGNLKVSVSPADSATITTTTYGTTDCTGTATSSGTTTGRTFGLGNTESVRLEAPATASGRSFANWTYTTSPVTTFTTRTVCISGNFTGGGRDITANYVAAASAATTTTLASSANPSVYGDSVTFTATVTSSPTNPAAGSVTFKDGAVTLCSDVVLSGNKATCSTSVLQPGSHSITGSYTPATGFQASTSNPLAQTVDKRTVTGSFTAADKVYDGTTAATIVDRNRTGVLAGDDVQLSGGSATFGTASIGQGKTVTGTGFTLSGTDAAKYRLASATLTTTASIAARGLTVTFTAGDKVYDGTRTATITSSTVSGAAAGDTVGVEGGTALFGTANAGADKTVTATGFVLNGADKDNYAIQVVNPAKAAVTPKAVTGSFTAAGKTYDRTTSAFVTGTSLTGVVGSDDVSLTGGSASFADANSGSDKTVVLSGASLSGADRANYELGQVNPAKATIAPKPVTGSFTAAGKTYDGNDSASVTGRSLAGVIQPDEVSLSGGTATFGTRHAGTGKTVTLTGATLAGADKANYTLSGVDTTKADITPLEISGAFEAADKAYDGTTAAVISGRSLVGAVDGDDVALTAGTATFDTKAVGQDKTVTGTGFTLTGAHAGNYALKSATLKTTADITRLAVVGHFAAADKAYDATADASVTDRWVTGQLQGDDVDLVDGTARFGSKDVGQGKTVTLTGAVLSGADAGNYSLDPAAITTKADVTPRELLVKANDASKTYGAANPAFTGTISGVQGGEDVTLGLSSAADNSSGVGTYAIVPSAQGTAAVLSNYAVKATNGTLTVTKRELVVTADDKSKVYGDANPTLTGDISGVQNGDAVTLGLSTAADKTTGVGGYAIVPSAQGADAVLANYSVKATNGTLTVTKRDLVVKADDKSKVFGDANPALTGNIFGVQNGDAVTLGLSTAADKASAVGTYPIVASAQGTAAVLANYAVKATNGMLTVSKRALLVSAHDKSKVYGDANPVLTGDISGVQNGDAVTLGLTTAADKTSGVGDYAIVASAQGDAAVLANYEVKATDGTLTVTKRDLVVKADDKSKVYGDANPALTGQIVGVQNDDPVTLHLSTVADKTSGVGPYQIVAAANGTAEVLANYEVKPTDGTLTVTRRELLVTADDASKVYGDANPTLTGKITGVQNGDAVTLGLSTGVDKTTGVGNDYPILASAQGTDTVLANYTVKATNGTFTVTKRELLVKADDASKAYGAANPALTGTISGIQNDDPVTLGLSTAVDKTTGVGTYPILASAQGTSTVLANYDVKATNGSLTVTKRELVVKAHDKSKVYGDANPALTGDISGVQNGDAVTLGLSTAVDKTTGVGDDYPIVASAQGTDTVLANYDVKATNGTLTVTKRELLVKAHDKSKVYGDANPALTGDISGIQNGDAVTLGLSTAVDRTTGVGDAYPIVASAQGTSTVLANYDVKATNGTLTVTKRDLVVKAHDKSKVYGDANPALTGDISGIQNGDAVTLHLSTAVDSTTGVGSYQIAAGANGTPGVLANYEVKPTNGTLTVTKRDLVVKAHDKSKVYGDANPTLTGDISGVQNGDAVTLHLSTAVDTTTGVGSYQIAAGANGTSVVLANYEVKPTNGTLTVTRRELVVTADDKSKVYGDANPTLTGKISGVQNGDAVTLGLSTTADKTSGVGTHTIVASAQGTAAVLANYEVKATNGTLTVTKRELVVTADDKSKVYGAAVPALTGTVTGAQNGDVVTAAFSTTATGSSGVGQYPIKAAVQETAVLANYDVKLVDGTLSVTKARLTLTADDQSKILGSANPALTFTVTGLVNGDTRSSALDSQPTVSTTATQASGVGSYPITVSGGSASNYELVYVSGTLRVLFSWAGFQQPINDTAHQVGLYESKFKLGQTIPVKFVLSDASGNVVQQAGSPTFTRTDYLGACDTGTDPEALTTVTASSGATFAWTGSQYQYNWSTKGITKAGEYRIHANLADGTQRSVYICLTK